ncbi:MAG: recombinase family protein [Lawsonibacter sp.]
MAEEGITARTGRPFSLPGLREMLQNPVYCAADGDAWDYFAALGADLCFPRADCDGRRGLLAYQKRDYLAAAPRNPVDRWIIALGRHPALVSGATWRAVQELLTPDRAPVVHNRRALLSGLLFSRPVRGEAASQGPEGRRLRLHLPGQAAPGRGGLFLPQPVRRGGRSGGAGRPLRPVSPPGPRLEELAREEQRAACAHPPPAGRLGQGRTWPSPSAASAVFALPPVAHSRPSLQSSPCSLWAHPAAPAADCWPPCSSPG